MIFCRVEEIPYLTLLTDNGTLMIPSEGELGIHTHTQWCGHEGDAYTIRMTYAEGLEQVKFYLYKNLKFG